MIEVKQWRNGNENDEIVHCILNEDDVTMYEGIKSLDFVILSEGRNDWFVWPDKALPNDPGALRKVRLEWWDDRVLEFDIFQWTGEAPNPSSITPIGENGKPGRTFSWYPQEPISNHDVDCRLCHPAMTETANGIACGADYKTNEMLVRVEDSRRWITVKGFSIHDEAEGGVYERDERTFIDYTVFGDDSRL